MSGEEDGGGRSWPPVEYHVGPEKIREFVDAVGERRAIYRDREAARQAGYRDLVAPPMFAVVFAGRSILPVLQDPELGIDLKHMVHAGQEFVWGEPVCASDVITTTTELGDVSEHGRNKVYGFATLSRNQDDDEVARGTWTMLVKGG